MSRTSKLALPEILLLATGCILLLAVQLVYNRPPFYDEDDYLANVAVLHQYGFGSNYLLHLGGSAGPLYSMVHFLFEPFTNLQAPRVRWVNMAFLTGTTFLTYRTLRLFSNLPALFALYIMAVPMTYVIAGLALTEIPAMFFFSAAVFLVIKNTVLPGPQVILQMMIAGLCMGLCIIGRQPFLLTLAAFPIFFMRRQNRLEWLLQLAVFLCFSLALPCYVFVVWQGFMPVIEGQLYLDIAHAGTSYRLDFFFLCIFYFAVSMLIAAPRFFILHFNRYTMVSIVTGFVAITAANVKYQWISLLPLKGLIDKFQLTVPEAQIFSSLCGAAVIFSGLYFLICVFYHFHQLQYPNGALFFAAALLLIAISCIKITWGFSSRYAGQGIPLLILLGSFFYRPSKFNTLRIGIGVITGIIAVLTYFIGR